MISSGISNFAYAFLDIAHGDIAPQSMLFFCAVRQNMLKTSSA